MPPKKKENEKPEPAPKQQKKEAEAKAPKQEEKVVSSEIKEAEPKTVQQTELKLEKQWKMFGGHVKRYSHFSTSTKTKMTFSVFIPPAAEVNPVPCLYWLSGLECTDDNFITKAGAQRAAATEGIMLVVCDTSPREAGIPGEKDSWDFGVGAGFYLDATQEPWRQHYNMYSYVSAELPSLIEREFKVVPGVRAIAGHSMGGHGALTIAFKHPDLYTSVSAFAPICNPSNSPWGQKAFTGYLGPKGPAWSEYDATELLIKRGPFPSLKDILIDQGADDPFYKKQEQLLPENLQAAAAEKKQPLTLRIHPGFDHSYFFVASFIEEHVHFHAQALRAKLQALAQDSVSAENLSDFAASQGKVIKCRAAVAWKPKEPLKTETVEVAPPKAGEVRLKVIANALCHTDYYTLSGQDPEGLFPCILGHEAGAIVESVGEGVKSVKVGDHVIPCYTPQCCETECIFCQSPKTNLCPKIRATQGNGVMPDGTSRFSINGQQIYHFMGCSTFSEYTVVAEISAARINPALALSKAALLGCGVSTGFGAVWNTCKVETGSSVAVFGLGAVGLAVVQAAKIAGARRIFAIDLNKRKFPAAIKLGATDCLCPTDFPQQKMDAVLIGITKWGVDYTFDCTGNVEVMREALQAAHRGWGQSCVIGVAPAGKEIATRPFQLVTGRVWKGTAFGGWKSREAVPKLVERVLSGELPIDHFITHIYNGVDATNDAVHTLHQGDCLRALVIY